MFEFILQLSLGILAVSTFLYVLRVIKGPSIPLTSFTSSCHQASLGR